jgi:hypothetical protein
MKTRRRIFHVRETKRDKRDKRDTHVNNDAGSVCYLCHTSLVLGERKRDKRDKWREERKPSKLLDRTAKKPTA